MDKELIKQCPLFKNGTSKREIRHNFFNNINFEEQAYLLGFIFADGCVNEERHTLSININKQDQYIIDLLKDISPEAYTREQKSYKSIATVRGRQVKNHGSIRTNISSKILIEDLKKYGVIQNKTYTDMHLPIVSDDILLKHFIRGYFDGDGCFTYSIRKPNSKNREINYRISAHWTICCKTSSILLEMQKYFTSFEIKTNINYIKRDDMYNLTTSSRKEIIKIFNLLFHNCNYSLPRKYNKIKYYVNTEVSQIITDHRNAQEVNVNESNNPPKSVEQDNDWLENNYFDYIKS